jgi:peptide-methionine (S)-S-oxide reductase
VATERAVFGAGCFWGVEEDFRTLPGVISTKVGYAGGDVPNPSYEQVCTARTGHAESLAIEFDPAIVSYRDLLTHFFSVHDPTQVNGQGPDIGPQYRSVIFPLNGAQEAEAKAAIAEANASGRFRRPIATTVEPPAPFYDAEDYHQQYVAKRQARSTSASF